MGTSHSKILYIMNLLILGRLKYITIYCQAEPNKTWHNLFSPPADTWASARRSSNSVTTWRRGCSPSRSLSSSSSTARRGSSSSTPARRSTRSARTQRSTSRKTGEWGVAGPVYYPFLISWRLKTVNRCVRQIRIHLCLSILIIIVALHSIYVLLKAASLKVR